MEDLACLVQHVQAQGVGGNGHQGPAGLGAAEDGTLDGFHVPAQRTGSVDHIVDIAAVLADMLESMQVAAHVHIHVVMPEQDGVHALLHVGALALVLVRVGIDRMVAYLSVSSRYLSMSGVVSIITIRISTPSSSLTKV